MASPLADIDWTDLDSAEMTTAVFLLCKATQERYNIGRMSIAGNFFNNPGQPQVYFFPSTASASSVPAQTAPQWELNDGDPLEDWTGEIEQLFDECCRFYVDTDKTDDSIGTTGDTLRTYNETADAPLTYPNRLLEKAGYESYPDLSVYAPEEVKKWYDILTTLKVKYDTHISGVTGEGVNDNYLIYTGEFDKDQSTIYGIDETGADYYGGATSGEGGEAVTNTTPFTDFKTGNGNLFASGSSTFTDGVDTGTPPYHRAPYKLSVGRRATGGNYWNWIRSFRLTVVIDWTDVESIAGVTGRPLDYDESIDGCYSVTETFPTGEDPATTFPTTTVNEIYRRTIDSVTEVGDTHEVVIDDQITVGTMPTNITDLNAGESVEIEYVIKATRNIFYENWDGDGGFEYFTP